MPQETSDILEKIRHNYSNEFQQLDPERKYLSSLFYDYNKVQGLFENPEEINRLFLSLREIVRTANGKNKTWLDIGCGDGTRDLLLAIQIGLRGKVIGIDTSSKKIKDANTLKGFFQEIDTKITFKEADGCSMSVETNSIDVVFMSSVITHCREPGLLLEETTRVLKKGGTLIFYDENNSLKIAKKNRNYDKIHQMIEYGPITDEFIFGSKTPYREMRKKLLAELVGDSTKVTEKMLDETFGLYGDYLAEYVKAWETDSSFIPPNLPNVPHNPASGFTPDYLLSPFDMSRKLKKLNFAINFFNPRIEKPRPLWKNILISIADVFPLIYLLLHDGFWIKAVKS